MSKPDAGPIRGPKGPFTMRTRSKTAPAGTVRRHFSGKFAHLGRKSNIERASLSGPIRKHFTPTSRVTNIERDDSGNIVYKRRVSSAGMPRTDSESGRKRFSTSDPIGSSQAGLSQVETPVPKRRRTIRSIADGQMTEADNFCWLCHKDGHVICCELCPRVYHSKCLGIETHPSGEWVCPECQKIMRAECVDTRSKAMAMITGDQLCVLLKYAVQRMKHPGSEPFQKPVDVSSLPTYKDFVVHPMDLSLIEKNIRRKVYGSTEALLADAKWILHNCVVFNGAHHKLTTSAKMVVKICRHEMTEIEICPDCYTNSCTKRNDNWFCVPCRTPHTLVWAKMKGYPFWPAKTLREVDGQLDVRFFGEHDRAWVPVSQVYLLSRQPPLEMKNTRGGYRQSMDEVQRHIDRLKEKFGSFHYASFRTPFDRKKPYISKKPAVKGEASSTAKQSSEIKSTSTAMATTAPPGGSTGRNTRTKSSVKRGGEPSIVSKTASAVKSKYNSIITTRRAKALAAGGETGSSQSQPVKTGSRRGNGVGWRSNRGRSKLSDSCRSVFEMSDASALQSEATRFRPLVSLTRMSPDILRPLGAQNIVNKIEDTIKKRDALEAADLAETVADHPKDESKNSEMEQASMSDAKPQSSDQKDKSGTKQMEREKSPVNEAQKTLGTTDVNVVSAEIGAIGESTCGENIALAVACETDSHAPSLKKNKFLESLVETCKAKLGVDASESSPGTEEGSSSSEDSSKSSEDLDRVGEVEGEKTGKSEGEGEKDATRDNDTTSVDAAGSKVDMKDAVPDAPAKMASEETKDAALKTATTSSANTHKNPQETGNENTLEAGDKKAAVVPPVDKAKSDTTNKQSSANSSDSKSKVPSDGDDVKYIQPDDSTPDLEMEVDSISDSDSDPGVDDLIIDLNKERSRDDKQLTISVDKATNDAFVIDLDKEDDQKHTVKATGAGSYEATPKGQKVGERVITATSRSELHSSKKPVKYKSEKQKEIERQQRQLQVSNVKSSQSATLLPSSNQVPAVKRSSSFPEICVELPTQAQIDDDIDGVDGVLDDVMSEKRLKENVEKLDVSKYADRLMMSVRSTLQDMYFDLVNTEATKAVKRTFQLELDKIMWQHRQQLIELRQNANLTLAEMRASLECDKQKVVSDLKLKMELEKLKAVNETKKKQWCAHCSKEANFYCCWNTSYCDYPCQQAAWPEHMSKCTQTRSAASQATESPAGTESKPDLARQTNISHQQGDEPRTDHQMALSYTFGGTHNAVGGMNSAVPYASTLQPGIVPNVQPLQSVGQMPLQLRYPGTTPNFQQQYAHLPPGQMVGHGGLPGQSGGPLLYSAVLRQPPAHTVGLNLGQSPGQLMMAPGTNILRGPMTYRPPQGY